jgi:hypothetical protein
MEAGFGICRTLAPLLRDAGAVGGCSFMIRVHHAAVAIAEGLYETVLITHGESGRSGFERTPEMSSHPPTFACHFMGRYGPPTSRSPCRAT